MALILLPRVRNLVYRLELFTSTDTFMILQIPERSFEQHMDQQAGHQTLLSMEAIEGWKAWNKEVPSIAAGPD